LLPPTLLLLSNEPFGLKLLAAVHIKKKRKKKREIKLFILFLSLSFEKEEKTFFFCARFA
jgi:hypothetical protein